VSTFVLSQILAGIAFTLGLTSFQFKSRRSVLLCLSLLTVFNSSHFFLLGRPGPATLQILTGVRYLTATFTMNRKLMYLFLLVSIGAFLATFRSPLSLLALVAVLLGTYGSFQPADRTMRVFLMLGNSIWLIHNIFASTPVAMVMEASFLTSNVLGYWRFYGTRRGNQFR
jgi:hypothetical protein